MPLSNPWMTNLGRLVVPNFFLNLRLLEFLTRKYNKEKRYIQLPNGDPFIRLSAGSIQEVVGMAYEPYMPLSFIDLEGEYTQIDTTHTVWKLAIHKTEKGRIMEEDGPPFEINLFRQYLQYTYWACNQVCGEEVPDIARIGPLVLTADIQMHDSRPFDYATYLT